MYVGSLVAEDLRYHVVGGGAARAYALLLGRPRPDITLLCFGFREYKLSEFHCIEPKNEESWCIVVALAYCASAR